MFNSFRQLMSDDKESDETPPRPQATPTRSTNDQGSNLEFTPIGSNTDLGKQNTLHFDRAQMTTSKMSDQAQQRLPTLKDPYSSRIISQQNTEILRTIRKQSKPLHRTRIDNNGYESATSSSAFDDSDIDDQHTNRQPGLFGRSIIRDGTNVLPSFDSEKITERIIDGEESNMVKKQTELLQQLKAENMNLRVELRTLWSLPRDQGKLAQQVVNLNQQLLMLKEQNDSLMTSNGATVSTNEDVSSLKSQLDELDEQLHLKDQMYQTVRDEKDDLIQEKIKMTDEIDILNNKIDQYEFKLKNITSNDNDNDRMSQLEIDIQKKEANIDNLERENNQLSDENHQLRSDLDKLEQEFDNNSDFKDKLRDLESSNREMESKIDDLNEELDTKETENNELKKQQASLIHENNQLELKLAVFEAKKETVNLGVNSTNKRLEELTNRLLEASQSIDQMDMEMGNKDGVIKNLSSDIKELNKRIDSLMDDNENLNSLLRNYKEVETESKGLAAKDVEEVNLHLKKSERENTLLRDTIDQLQTKLKSSNDANYDTYIDELESTKISLARELEKTKDMLNSEISFRKDLESKLNTGDDEITFEDIEKLRFKIESERELFRAEFAKMTNIIETLEEERNNALDDFDNIEAEKINLINDFELIQKEYQTVKKNEAENDFSIDSLKQDLKKLSVQYKMEIDSHNNTKDSLHSLIDQLKSSIEQRNMKVARLENELANALRDSNNDIKSTKLVDELSLKVKSLVNEREELVNQKYKLDEQLSRANAESDQLKFKLDSQNEIIKDFESNLRSLTKERRTLQNKLSIKSDGIDDLSSAIDELKIQNSKISTGVKEIISQEGKILKGNDLLVGTVNGNREDVAQLRSQLEETYKDYNNLRDTLLKKIESIREERNEARSLLDNTKTDIGTWKSKSDKLERKIEILEDAIKIEQTEKIELLQKLQKVSSKLNDQQQYFPPTPISPSKLNENVIKTLKFELQICELQKQLLSLKLQETCEHYDDQKYQNKFFQVEIDSKNETIQKNYKLIKDSGIDVSFKEKLTKFSGRSRLRIAFLIVLASVRMKRRLEESNARKSRIQNLKKEIVKKRYLVEKV